MAADVRALLDELMGKERNVPLNQRSGRALTFDDPLVCKYAIAGLCPNTLFKNTKSDLGPCGFEMHEDHIQWEGVAADYAKQDEREKERYERRLHKYMEDLIRDMDRKIAKSKERAAAESAPRDLRPEDQARVADLQQKAKDALERSQAMGEMGDVDASIMLAQQAEDFKVQHDRLIKSLTTPDRTMTVCEICGIFANSSDNEQRRQEHLTGKQYLGWKLIRETHAKLSEKLEKSAGSSYRFRSHSTEPAREDGRRDDRDRSRDRERDRLGYDDGRGRERERSPARGAGREGYRERDYPGRNDHRSSGYGRESRDSRGGGRSYDDRERERDRGGRGNEFAPPQDLYARRHSSGRERDRY